MSEPAKLKQDLRGWMIFFIVMSVVIGAGIFTNGGSAMKIAGPGGALLAFAIMSAIAICVSECISELVQLFPVPNAIVEYVRKFIDEDLGWAVGIAYWLTYCAIFAAQNMNAAQLASYWGGSEPPLVYRTILFYVVSPLLMLFINAFGVEAFGWIETFGGAAKILLVVATTFIMWIMAGSQHNNELQDGFQHDTSVVRSNVGAVLYIIPTMAFGYVGIETITMAAFEAAPQSLRWPSKNLIYIAAVIYLLCMLSQSLNVDWENDHLPILYGTIGNNDKRENKDPDNPFSHTIVIIAIFNWGKKELAGVLNGAIIFSVLSASNTTLYVASRTLYGMAWRVREENVKKDSLLGWLLGMVASVDPRTGVPLHALILSWLMFIWVPFMSLNNDYRVQFVVEIIQTASSVSCLIVWIALCVTFLRYWWLQKFFNKRLENTPGWPQFRREHPKEYGAHTWLMSLQPIPAVIGMIGCVLTFAFCSATWWYTEPSFVKAAIAYAAQFIVLLIFLVLKIIRLLRSDTPLQWFQRSQVTFKSFTDKLDALLRLIQKDQRETSTSQIMLQPGANTDSDQAVLAQHSAA